MRNLIKFISVFNPEDGGSMVLLPHHYVGSQARGSRRMYF